MGALAVIIIMASGVTVLGIARGWWGQGDVVGDSEGFRAAEAPVGNEDAASWPEYGFDDRRTRANTELALAPPFRRAWTHDAGSLLEFPPVIGDGRVIVGTNAGLALALDQETGEVRWRTRLRGRVASSAALVGDEVVFTTTSGDLDVLDAATGERRWRLKIGSSSESSPLVADGDVYVGTLDGAVMRIDMATRRRVWTARAGGDVKAGLAASGNAVVVGDYGGQVSAFRRRDGRLAWRTESPAPPLRGPGRFYAGPAVAYGRVFVGNVNGRVLALSAADGGVAWLRATDDFVYSSAAVAGETVYVGSYDKRLYALDAVSGRPRWSIDVGERISGSPTVIGDLVYVSTIAREPREGVTVALDRRTGEERWRFPDGRYTPAVGVDGLLVLTGVRTLYGLVPAQTGG